MSSQWTLTNGHGSWDVSTDGNIVVLTQCAVVFGPPVAAVRIPPECVREVAKYLRAAAREARAYQPKGE